MSFLALWCKSPIGCRQLLLEGHCWKHHKINVITIPVSPTPTVIEKQHGSVLSILHFPMSVDRQTANLGSNKHKCHPRLKIATFNCRTLKSDYGVLQLIEFLQKPCIDVLAIQEHRRRRNSCNRISYFYE